MPENPASDSTCFSASALGKIEAPPAHGPEDEKVEQTKRTTIRTLNKFFTSLSLAIQHRWNCTEMLKTVSLVFVSALLLSALPTSVVEASPETTVYVDPSTATVSLGEQFTVLVNILNVMDLVEAEANA